MSIAFPRKDFHRVPEHWRVFGTRLSPITGSARLAANPTNAILNYLYAVLESEARLAITALGLDPGLGVLHVDGPTRDSFACDLMEPVRPQIDIYVLDWISREPLRREWFFEESNGNCRLVDSFAAQLSETATGWGKVIAPLAEWVAKAFWIKRAKPAHHDFPPTRLTQSNRSLGRGKSQAYPAESPVRAITGFCRLCGDVSSSPDRYCAKCAVKTSTDRLTEVAKLGRIATIKAGAQAKRSQTQSTQAAALKAWDSASKPDWLDRKVYIQRVQPLLVKLTVGVISTALDISRPYAVTIRNRSCIPHARHWLKLSQLVGIAG